MIKQLQILSRVDNAAAVEPVSLDDLKSWVRVDFDDDNAIITAMGKGARQMIENYCNRSIVAQDITAYLEFESDDTYKTFVFPYSVGVSGVVVNELDEEDVPTLKASGTDYFVRASTLRVGPGRYSISYTTVPGTIPEDLKEAIKMEVAQRYSNKGENGTGAGLSEGAKAKAQSYVIPWL